LLDTPESIAALIRHVEASPSAMPRDSALRERFQHSLQASVLTGMSEVVREAEARRFPPWLRSLAISVPLAWFLGHLFAETVYTCKYPSYGFFNTFGGHGPFDVWVVVAGIAMGLVWFVILMAVQFLAWRWRVGQLVAAQERYEGQLRALFPEYGSAGGTTGLRDAEAVTQFARRAAQHDSLTQPLTAESRTKLLAELRQLLDMQERR
jgi:hypothetical protein